MNARLGAAALALVVSLGAATATAEPVTLRFASAAPDGTAWAREMRAFGREIAAESNGQVQVKWYLSGITGDELQSAKRLDREQLDGIISGGMLCQKLSPSLRATGVAGLFRDRGEARYVLSRLRPTVADEVGKAGYKFLGIGEMGFSVVFSKTPVRSYAELARLKPWLWDLDETLLKQLLAAGLHPVPVPIETAGRAFDDGRVDGFIALPAAALAFQWSTQTRYVTDLRIGYLTGCMLVARRAWDVLTHDQQQLVESAAAKLQHRIEDVATQNDDMLIGGLFARQGLTALPVPPGLQKEFSDAARAAQAAVASLVPPGTMERIAGWLAEYRKERR